MYKQVLDPVGDSLGLSTIFAVLPLVTLFVLLGGLKLKAHVAALWSLLVAILVAIIVYSMPVGQTLDSGLEGAAFGLFPIMWIVVNAIWIYNMLERSGYFAVIKRSFGRLSDDQRVQAVLIAFCFGALLEALAGFGTPVAICSVMLIGAGLRARPRPPRSRSWPTPRPWPSAPSRCRSPRWRRSPACPRTTSAPWSAARRRFLALVVPLILVGMVDGRRGIKAAWPAALVGGLAFAIGQFAVLELPLGRAGRHRRLAGRRRRDHRAAAVLAARRRRRRARRPAPGHGRRRERGRPAALREGGEPARRRRARRRPSSATPRARSSPPSRRT